MKLLKQFLIILFVSFLGEILNYLIPLPIPASIYGILIMFLALELHIIPLSSVKDAGRFLIEIMPVMFIPAAVGLLNAWNILKPNWIIYTVIMFATTFIVMILSGKVTQAVIRKGKKRETAEISPSEEVTAEPVESPESNETIGSDVRKGGDET
ncbi:MAG: CidA/LrgA family protein [Eubacterium sp.]|nr:CidA/LrgA family protein [Eubacterium sp.]